MRSPLRILVSAAATLAVVAACSSDNGEGTGPDRTGGRGVDVGAGDRDVRSPVERTDVADETDAQTSTDADPGSTDVEGRECIPARRRCSGGRDRQQCDPSGSEWIDIEACGSEEVCSGLGLCQSPCTIPGKFEGSTVSCEFWSVDLGQWHVGPDHFSLDPSVSTIPHAVLIGNPGDTPATITFDVADGTPIPVTDAVVPAGHAVSFLMPILSQQETGITRQAIRVNSSVPVVAQQFNPASNAPGFALHSTDASLLLPLELLGAHHVVVSQGGFEGFAGGPPTYGYFSIVAVEPGDTEVTIDLTADTVAGGRIPAMTAGETLLMILQQGEVLTMNGVPGPLLGPAGGDLTGTVIRSSRRVAVFGGHHCMVILGGNCDHLESQLLPVERWGRRYIAAPFETPNRNSLYRVLVANDDTVLQTNPNVAGLNGRRLQGGEWAEATTDIAFEISANNPISVAQFMGGNDGENDPHLVDASMTVLIPVDQYRDTYPLLITEGFSVDRLILVRPAGASITVNGEPVTTTFNPVAGTGFEVGDIRVSQGVQLVESSLPIGVTSYGYAHKVSYAVPGGMGAR